MSLLLVAGVVAAGAVAGGLGSLLGIGGGVFLVPFLNAGLGVDFEIARGVSLMTVIATSSAVSAAGAAAAPPIQAIMSSSTTTAASSRIPS